MGLLLLALLLVAYVLILSFNGGLKQIATDISIFQGYKIHRSFYQAALTPRWLFKAHSLVRFMLFIAFICICISTNTVAGLAFVIFFLFLANMLRHLIPKGISDLYLVLAERDLNKHACDPAAFDHIPLSWLRSIENTPVSRADSRLLQYDGPEGHILNGPSA